MRQIEKWVEVNAPLTAVFARFSNLQFFPQWMTGVTAVRLFAGQRTHWIGHTANGEAIRWLAETTALDAPHHLAWQTVRGPALAVAADFETTKRDTTLLRLVVDYDEDEAARLWPHTPDAQWEADLARFKGLVEEEAQQESAPLIVGPVSAAPAWTAATATSPDAPTLVRARPLKPGSAPTESRPDRSTAPLPRLAEPPAATSDEASVEPTEARLSASAPQLITEWTDEPPAEATGGWAAADQSRPGVEQPLEEWPEETHRPLVVERGNEARRHAAHAVLAAQASTASTMRRRPLVAYLLIAALLVLALATLRFFAWPPRSDSRVNSRPAPTAAPDVTDASDAATSSRRAEPGAAVPSVPPSRATPAINERTARTAPSVAPHTETPAPRAAPTEAATAVKAALDDWIAATNSGDLSRLMGHYANTAQRYYQRANVSRSFIRADKQRLLHGADGFAASVVGAPEITWQQDGRVAQVRFRKQYERMRAGQAQRGEVLQELFLSQGDRGWEIFSERDLRVLR